MNTNIFDFQNSESSMQFNPLFLPVNTFVDNPGSVKSFKISNSSYLFSDIIKVFAGASLVKNNDLNLSITSEISSKQIPAGNTFSFSLTDNNNLQDLSKLLNNGKVSSISLKEIIALFSQLFKVGQNNLLQEGTSLSTDKSVNNNVLTSDGLKAFLNELSTLFNNADVKDSSSKEKNKTGKDVKEIISKILNSLNNGGPVLINIIGKNETLKIELNKTDSEALKKEPETVNLRNNFINGLSNENETYLASDKSSDSEAINDNKLTVSAEMIDQNSNEISTEKGTQNSSTISAEKTEQESGKLSTEQTEQNLKTKIQAAGSDKIEKLFAELGEKETGVLKDNKILSTGIENKAETQDLKTMSRKTTGSIKIFNAENNSKENDVYKLKFEIVDNENNIHRVKDHPDLSNAANREKNSSIAAKSKSDSLTIENLVASKSSLKNINKLSNQADITAVKTDKKNIQNVKIEINNAPAETKIGSKNLNPVYSNPENDIKIVKENNKNSEFPAKIKLNKEKTEQGTGRLKSVKDDIQKSFKVEHSTTNKVKTDNPGNPKTINNDANLNAEVSKEIKVAGTDNKSINQRETVSNSHLSDNIKVDNSLKNIPNNPSENNFSDNLSGTKQDLINNSKGQEQISSDRENAFSSYLNKIDANIVQNNKGPANLNNLADQIKTIDSTEIVNEISKLASDKDQKNIVLKLVPETLGKVKILLDISNNIIHAHAEVENEAAKSLIQNNLGNLKQALAQQGMQLNSLNISLSNHQEQKSNRSYSSKRKFSYSEPQIGEIDEKEHTNVSKHYGYNTYEFLA